MARAVADDLKDLDRLLDLVRKRKHSREAGERESLKAEAARLLKAASGAAAGRVRTLAAQVENADAKALPPLRAQLDKLGAEIEQAARLEAGRALRSGERLLPRGHGKAGAVPGRLKKVDELVGSVRGEMEKDDLAKIVSLGRELSLAVSSASPISRPPIRIALAAAGVLVVAGGLFGWRYFSNPDRPQTFHLRLSGTEQQSAVVRLAREGRFIEGSRQAKGNDVVEFALEPGRYEVFVNDRYTGRIIQVPGPAEVGDVPVP
jgi:hypothetical protein